MVQHYDHMSFIRNSIFNAQLPIATYLLRKTLYSVALKNRKFQQWQSLQSDY